MTRKRSNPAPLAAGRARNCQGLGAFDSCQHNPAAREFQAQNASRPQARLRWQTVETDPGLVDRWMGLKIAWRDPEVFEAALDEATHALDCLFQGFYYVPAGCATQEERLRYYDWCCDIVQLAQSGRRLH